MLRSRLAAQTSAAEQSAQQEARVTIEKERAQMQQQLHQQHVALQV